MINDILYSFGLLSNCYTCKYIVCKYISDVRRQTSDQVVSNPLVEFSHSGEDARSSYPAPLGSTGDNSNNLPGGEVILPRHQRTSAVSLAAVFALLSSSTEMEVRPIKSEVSASLCLVSLHYLIFPVRSTPSVSLY